MYAHVLQWIYLRIALSRVETGRDQDHIGREGGRDGADDVREREGVVGVAQPVGGPRHVHVEATSGSTPHFINSARTRVPFGRLVP